jgi:hypothetical protein
LVEAAIIGGGILFFDLMNKLGLLHGKISVESIIQFAIVALFPIAYNMIKESNISLLEDDRIRNDYLKLESNAKISIDGSIENGRECIKEIMNGMQIDGEELRLVFDDGRIMEYLSMTYYDVLDERKYLKSRNGQLVTISLENENSINHISFSIRKVNRVLELSNTKNERLMMQILERIRSE